MERLYCSCGWELTPQFDGDIGWLFHAIARHKVHVSCGRKIGPFDCCTVVEGDCLELMKGLPSESVHLIFTDPPYGHNNAAGDLLSNIGAAKGDGSVTRQKPIANDSPEGMRRVVSGMLHQAARVLWNDSCCCCCCCCCGGGPSPTFAWLAERLDREGLAFFHSVIWDKLNPGLGWRYRRQHEMVMVAHRRNGKLRWNEAVLPVSNIVRVMPDQVREHPNEKPLALVEPFVLRHSETDDFVLDPFCGSGTTLVAAKKLGRHFLGFEISPEYCEIARKRIALVEAQPTLFEPKETEQLRMGGFE